MGVCLRLINGKDNSRTRVLLCLWAETTGGEEKRVGLRFSWGQAGLSLSPLSCSWQRLQHLLDTQSFPHLSRKTDCSDSLLFPALAPRTLACPHKGQTKDQWPVNDTQACSIGIWQKGSLHLCLASEEIGDTTGHYLTLFLPIYKKHTGGIGHSTGYGDELPLVTPVQANHTLADALKNQFQAASGWDLYLPSDRN